MTETNTFPPPEDPEDSTAQVLPFPLKKDPAPEIEAPGEVKPGEWEANLPDAEDPEAEGLEEGQSVDPPREVYPPSVSEWMEAKDKARLAVLPDWVKLPDQRKAVRKWAVRHYSTVAGYHAVRLPCIYAPKVLVYSPRGAWRWSAAVGRWVFDAEGKALRLAAVEAEDAGQYLSLSRQRNDRVRLRGIVAALAGFIGLAAVLTLYVMAPSWLLLLSVATLTTTLGVVGAPADRPLIDMAKVTFRKRRLSSDIVIRAHDASGLTGKDQSIAFPRPIGRDGDGWRVVVDLPYGKTFEDALKAHARLASGMDIAPTQLFLDKDETSGRRVSYWIADRDPLAVPSGKSPLLGATRVDFWKPFPWGVDERGNPVMATMLWLSLLVGAVPRQGKTFSARTIALAAALDPYVRLYVFDGKASPDWRKFAKVAHRIAFGIVPKNGFDPVVHLLTSLRELKADVEDRYHRLSELPLHICPEGKLTPEISRDKKLNMPLTLFVVDEVQEYLQHPEHGKEILSLLVYLARVAPAVGVSVMTSTQKPDDKACPSELRDQHQARFALRVGAYQVSDTILGAGSYSEGLDASKLLKSHKGVGLLKGMSDDSGIVRTYLANGQDAERVLTRAAALREAEGTLSGDAAGEAPAPEVSATILDDVAAVLGKGEAKVWSETIVDRLADLRPDAYGPWAELEPKPKAEALGSALKPFGIATDQISRRIDGRQVNKRGIKRDDLATAITERNKKRDAG
ncbi:cell division protein FtsK [Streptomyces lunaelactis]|uniref:cell division protein FtsK n=1 Tax=Streptomyces lunaelactis TaxID=1535768 RepID=UPI001584E429|nr:cell division protein FtsK [Streptomyces lunaelactis]NUK08658.1 cell division protein FtsK [Streptomyces lunaelactis]NUL10749.1 cell division protein FtsK [Streptomyces lunaelactis]NUL22575.1 cell division protein FtsK [Streptomyces lunaelactis]